VPNGAVTGELAKMTETDLTMRLERLERDNRRVKIFAVGILVLAAGLSAVSVIYATRHAAQTIKAHEFDVVDESGSVRVRMTVNYWGTLKGEARDLGAPGVELLDAEGRQLAGLDTFAGPSLRFWDEQGNPTVQLGMLWDGLTFTRWGGKGRVSIQAPESGAPSISLADAQGFELDLGHTSTTLIRTGEEHGTSAASITMFGNDEKHHVIWQAP